jgi:hypothetical protein
MILSHDRQSLENTYNKAPPRGMDDHKRLLAGGIAYINHGGRRRVDLVDRPKVLIPTAIQAALLSFMHTFESSV